MPLARISPVALGTALLALLLSAAPASAQTFTWTGGGGADNVWSTTTNWSGGAGPSLDPPPGNVIFSNGTSLTNVADADFQLLSIQFNSGAGAFTINGSGLVNGVNIGTGGVVNNTANTETINASILLTGAQAWRTTSTGALTFGAAANVNLQTNTLTVGVAASTAAGAVTINGIVSGTGTAGITKLGTNTLNLGGASTFNGAVLVNEGVVNVTAANGLGNTTGTTT